MTSSSSSAPAEESTPVVDANDKEDDEDEVVVEEVADEDKREEIKEPKMKKVTVDEWIQMNPQPPIWTRYVDHLAFISSVA